VAVEALPDFVIPTVMSQFGHAWNTGRIDLLHEQHNGAQL
jgi:hypothetical protein